MHPQVKRVLDQLKARADMNGDGKVDRQDLNLVRERAEQEAAHFTAARTPLKALLIAFFLGVLVTGLIAYSIGARAEPVGPHQIRAKCEAGFCVVPAEDLKKLLQNNDRAVRDARAFAEKLIACKTAVQT